MFNKLPENKLLATSLVLALGLSFSPFYGLSYLAAIILAARKLTFSTTFSTMVGRFFVSTLLLTASIMIVGLAAWLANLPIHPILVLIGFGLLILALSRLHSTSPAPHKFIDKGDAISILMAMIAPAIILISYQLPNPSHAATYQFLNNGWDNSSHLLMITTASNEGGYVYGPYEELRDKTITRFNSYPQSWHVASANIANGFGAKAFNQKDQLAQMTSYTVVLMLWFAALVYAFSRISWRLLLAVNNKKQQLSSGPVPLMMFVVANIIIQLVVLWGSLMAGFSNYIGFMVFMLLMASAVIDGKPREIYAHYTVAVISGGAAVLCWFLPAPAIALTIILAFGPQIKELLGQLFSKKVLSAWIPIFVTGIVSAAILIQITVFVLYSHISGGDQLNAGRLAGSFAMSQIFLLILVVYASVYWLRAKTAITHIDRRLIAVVAPMVILTASIYTYQLLTTETVSYYFGKSMGLLTLSVGIFFVPAFSLSIASLNRMKLPALHAVVAGLSVAAILTVGTSQPISGAYELLQSNSKTGYATAQAVVNYLVNYDPKETKLVILRDTKVAEDYNGNLASKLPHIPMTCAYSIVNLESSKSLERKIANLDTCASNLDANILVITSNETIDHVNKVKERHDNVDLLNVP